MPRKNSSIHEKYGVWITGTGDEINIVDLDLSHLLNIVALLYRKGGEDNPQRPKLVSLEKEVIKRLKSLHNV